MFTLQCFLCLKCEMGVVLDLFQRFVSSWCNWYLFDLAFQHLEMFPWISTTPAGPNIRLKIPFHLWKHVIWKYRRKHSTHKVNSCSIHLPKVIPNFPTISQNDDSTRSQTQVIFNVIFALDKFHHSKKKARKRDRSLTYSFYNTQSLHQQRNYFLLIMWDQCSQPLVNAQGITLDLWVYLCPNWTTKSSDKVIKQMSFRLHTCPYCCC